MYEDAIYGWFFKGEMFLAIEYLVNQYAKRFHRNAWRHARSFTGRTPELAIPKTIEDKFLWRKVFDHNPLFVTLTDKLAVKEYVRERTPDLGIAELLWVGDDLADLPRDLIGSGAVLKSNNASGRTLLLTSPDFDLQALRDRTKTWKTPYGVGLREWAYGQIEPKFMLEKLLPGAVKAGSSEIIFNCFGGQIVSVFQVTHPAVDLVPSAQFIQLTTTGTDKTKLTIHWADGTPIFHPNYPDVPLIPTDFKGLDRAFEVAQKLMTGLGAVRVDLYRDGDQLHFGELTLYPGGGGSSLGEEYHEKATAAWDLRDTWFLTTPQSGWRGDYANWLRRKLG